MLTMCNDIFKHLTCIYSLNTHKTPCGVSNIVTHNLHMKN